MGKGTKGRAWNVSNRSIKHKEWVNSLKLLGLLPIIKIMHCFRDADMAFIRESMVVSFLRKRHVKLFNRAPGGKWVPSGKLHPLHGKTKDLDIRRRISETRKRRKIPVWNKGKKTGPNPTMSAVQKIKMKGNKNSIGNKMSDEERIKMSTRLMGNQHRSRKIVCLNSGKIYNSIKEAWTELKLDDRSVSRVLKGEYRHTKGYRFEYVD